MAKMYKLIFTLLLIFISISTSQNNTEYILKRADLRGKISDVAFDIKLIEDAIEYHGIVSESSLSSRLTSKKLTLISLNKELEEL